MAVELSSSEPLSKSGLSVAPRVAAVLGTTIFSALMLLLVITAIPYGTVEVWWKAFFVCSVLSLTILWLIEGSLSDSWINDGLVVVLPVAALASLSLFQTVSIPGGSRQAEGLSFPTWNTFSFDPYQTRFFAVQLVALLLVALLLFRYLSTEKRLRTLINIILVIVVGSAIFGILRQTTQHKLGFGLPLLPLNSGYGQFINKNHFAYLMEMGFGLALGLMISRGMKREHLLFYAAALLPAWVALVLCGSRGGLIALMAQVMTAVLIGIAIKDRTVESSHARFARLGRSWPVRILLLVGFVAALAIGTLWIGGEPLAMKIEESSSQLTAGPDELREGVTRNDIWRTTWKMFLAHPVLGVGMGAYSTAAPLFHDGSGKKTPQEAHNDYLELLASGGVVGLLIGIWFVLIVVRRVKGNLRSRHPFHRAASLGAVIGISGVAVHSLLDFGLHMIVNAFVFTTLLVIATSKPRWANPSADQS
ncbi:MAG TPA: O-antigen ligase family protein [Pyrinomonadaceae bacterium]|nr:O-antigen ligase family protein [Pyrinomonadaceae bacterium]